MNEKHVFGQINSAKIFKNVVFLHQNNNKAKRSFERQLKKANNKSTGCFFTAAQCGRSVCTRFFFSKINVNKLAESRKEMEVKIELDASKTLAVRWRSSQKFADCANQSWNLRSMPSTRNQTPRWLLRTNNIKLRCLYGKLKNFEENWQFLL